MSTSRNRKFSLNRPHGNRGGLLTVYIFIGLAVRSPGLNPFFDRFRIMTTAWYFFLSCPTRFLCIHSQTRFDGLLYSKCAEIEHVHRDQTPWVLRDPRQSTRAILRHIDRFIVFFLYLYYFFFFLFHSFVQSRSRSSPENKS